MYNNTSHNQSQEQFQLENLKELSLQGARELEEQIENNEQQLPLEFYFEDEKLMCLFSEKKTTHICLF